MACYVGRVPETSAILGEIGVRESKIKEHTLSMRLFGRYKNMYAVEMGRRNTYIKE